MEFINYFVNNFQPAINIPIMIIIGIITFIASWALYGYRNHWNWHQGILEKSAQLTLLTVYMYFIITVTLINRRVTDEPEAEWIPLWSWYQVIVNHSLWLLEEIVLNIILFIPFGVLLKLVKNITIGKAFLIGLGFSLIIEILEYVLCRGLFEWDDMLHNALGCMIGALIMDVFNEESDCSKTG